MQRNRFHYFLSEDIKGLKSIHSDQYNIQNNTGLLTKNNLRPPGIKEGLFKDAIGANVSW